jgi:superfamily II DNA helicase RecQ
LLLSLCLTGLKEIRVLKKLIVDGEGSAEQKEQQIEMLNRVTAFCDNKHNCRRIELCATLEKSSHALNAIDPVITAWLGWNLNLLKTESLSEPSL